MVFYCIITPPLSFEGMGFLQPCLQLLVFRSTIFITSSIGVACNLPEAAGPFLGQDGTGIVEVRLPHEEAWGACIRRQVFQDFKPAFGGQSHKMLG